MSYVVFDTKAKSIYRDAIESWYHIPSRYVEAAKLGLGGWVLYREPRAEGGRMAYFAAARLHSVELDPNLENHYYVNVDNYIEFDTEVPWRDEAGAYREQWLRDIPRQQVGVQLRGRSVRGLATEDFVSIVEVGLQDTLPILSDKPSIHEEQETPERKIKTALVSSAVRERSFRKNVLSAYSDTCAFTKLSMKDLNGNPEVQAAHIKSVSHKGPDAVSNGLALSATVHWLFDRFLITLSDDLGLIYKAENIPNEIVRLLEPQRARILLPEEKHLLPAKRFVEFHRQMYEQLNEAS